MLTVILGFGVYPLLLVIDKEIPKGTQVFGALHQLPNSGAIWLPDMNLKLNEFHCLENTSPVSHNHLIMIFN